MNTVVMKKKMKIYTQEEVEDIFFDTPGKKRKLEESYCRFVKDNRMEVLKELGDEIKKARLEAGFTQQELADRLKTKKTTISRIENGRQNLTVNYLLKIASRLDGTVEINVSR